MGETPLAVLERITPTLSDFSRVHTLSDNLGGFTEHEIKGGTSLLWGLHKEDSIAIAKGYISGGSNFPEHVHKCAVEYTFVLSGCMEFFFPDKQMDTTRLIRGNSIEIPASVIHSVKIEIDTWYIAITVPADEAFPDVRNS
jgi:quercetin dioxygenase-like cupin family protein